VFVSSLQSSSQAGRNPDRDRTVCAEDAEHHLNTIKILEDGQDGKLLVLYRQKEADKDAMVFVCNRMSFWEAGILPLNYSRSR
jgi:hypothetical protein